MKLYTEEQVINALFTYPHPESTPEELLKNITPIELPSDEEIENLIGFGGDNDTAINGAKWMKEQILGKEDKTFKQKSKWTEVDNMTRRLK